MWNGVFWSKSRKSVLIPVAITDMVSCDRLKEE